MTTGTVAQPAASRGEDEGGGAGEEGFVHRRQRSAGVWRPWGFMTAGEQLIERGRKDRLEKGLETGHEQSLVKLLRARFGALPEAAVTRIRAANSAQLDVWFDRALTAVTLQDVLDGA